MSWTDERVELLKKLWSDGLSASQIAAELGGITRNAVIGKVHRLGLSGRAKSTSSAAPRQRKARAPSHMLRSIGRPAIRGNTALAHAYDIEAEAEPELIDNMKGLDFAPAAPGDERAYRILHQALAAAIEGAAADRLGHPVVADRCFRAATRMLVDREATGKLGEVCAMYADVLRRRGERDRAYAVMRMAAERDFSNLPALLRAGT